jgi:Tfp pilus assembly protein PilF
MKLVGLVLVLFVLTLRAQAQGACAQLGVNCSHPSPAVLSPDSAYFNPHPVTNNGNNNQSRVQQQQPDAPPNPKEIAHQQAIALLDRARQTSNRDEQIALVKQALTLYEYTPARQWLNRELVMDKVNALNQQGKDAYYAGDYAGAESLYRQALKLDPNEPLLTSNLAETQGARLNQQGNRAYETGDYAGAESLYRQALKLDPNAPVIAKNLAKLLNMLEQRRQEPANASAIQQSIQNQAETLTPTPTADGLDFSDGKPDAPLKDAVSDAPSDHDTHDTIAGPMGTRIANPHFVERVSVPVPGSDTNASDQLRATAHTAAKDPADLTKNYDEGGNKAAGHFIRPTDPSIDPGTFSAVEKSDKRMISALQGLDDLQAKRSQLDKEVQQLTVDRNNEKDPRKSAALTQKVDKKNNEYQANLLAITEGEQTVKKVKRTIDTEEEKKDLP